MLVSLTLMLIAGASTPPSDASIPPVCQDVQTRRVDAALLARPHKLGDEPPARRILTVLRSEGGCSRPVPVSDRAERFEPLPR